MKNSTLNKHSFYINVNLHICNKVLNHLHTKHQQPQSINPKYKKFFKLCIYLETLVAFILAANSFSYGNFFKI